MISLLDKIKNQNYYLNNFQFYNTKEIQCLKNILEREGISYQKELDQLKNSINTETFETKQGSRIVFPNEITKDMVNRFFARFWGHTDVYAKRVENK